MAVPFAITGIYAAVLGLMLIVLAALVIRRRVKYRVELGDGGNPALTQAIRVHANFVENVPLALVLLAIAEAQGAAVWLLHGLGAALLIGRVLHAIGLGRTAKPSFGRFVGTNLSWIAIIGAALAILIGAFGRF